MHEGAIPPPVSVTAAAAGGAVLLQAPAQGHWGGSSLASQLISHPPLMEHQCHWTPHFWVLWTKLSRKT